MGFLLLVSISLAGLEPFLSQSVLLGWSSTLGVMRRDWRGLMTVLVAGILRDAVLVSRFGSSGIVFVLVWLAGALASSRFAHPLIVVSVISALSALAAGTFTHPGTTAIGVVTTAFVAFLSTAIWSALQERRSGIRLRES